MADPRTQDSRICLLGDSFLHGVGDPTGHGWVGRVTERRRHEGWSLTSYALGVRMDTGPASPAGCRRSRAGCATATVTGWS